MFQLPYPNTYTFLIYPRLSNASRIVELSVCIKFVSHCFDLSGLLGKKNTKSILKSVILPVRDNFYIFNFALYLFETKIQTLDCPKAS